MRRLHGKVFGNLTSILSRLRGGETAINGAGPAQIRPQRLRLSGIGASLRHRGEPVLDQREQLADRERLDQVGIHTRCETAFDVAAERAGRQRDHQQAPRGGRFALCAAQPSLEALCRCP